MRGLLRQLVLLVGALLLLSSVLATGPQAQMDKAPLEQVLETISEEYEVLFTYDAKILAGIEVEFEFQREENLERVINRALVGTGLQYKYLGEKYYVIFKENRAGIRKARQIERKIRQLNRLQNSADISLQTTMGSPQERLEKINETTASLRRDVTVRGSVKNQTGDPLIGASIRVLNQRVGASTDENGNFAVTVPNLPVTLRISYIGYKTMDREVTQNQGRLNIRLASDVLTSEEVVQIGYSTKRKKDLTGAFGSISGERLEKRNLANFGEALQGETAGIQVSNGARPGEQAIIRIRGYNSPNGVNRPLILVDGQEVGRINTLDPNDIADITVLKDASAAAIYGFRAANGVILITTKKGVAGTQSFEYHGFYGWQQPTNTIELLNAEEYVSLINEAKKNAYLADPANDGQPIPDNIDYLEYTEEEVNQWRGQEGTDWQAELMRTAPLQNHHFTYRGSSNHGVYSLSVGYRDQDAIYRGSDFTRYSVRVNGENRFGKLKIGQNIAVLYSEQNTGGDFYLSRIFMLPPTAPVFWEDGRPGYDPKFPNIQIKKNPVLMSDLITWENRQTHTYGNIYAEYEFLPGLNARTVFRVDRRIEEKEYFEPRYAFTNESDSIIYEQQAFADQFDFKDLTWDWENYLTYKKSFGKHYLGLLAGTSMRKHQNSFLGAKGFGFPSDFVTAIGLATTNLEIFGGNTTYRILAGFGRLDYTYDDKYILTANVRRDGSSRFAPDNRWGTFPSVGLAWRVSEESFFDAIPFVSELKLRGTWGRLGNSDVVAAIGGDFAYQNTISFGVDYAFGNPNSLAQGAGPVEIRNADLRWEITEQWDAGIDVGLFNDALTLKVDYFFKTTKDVIVGVPIPAIAGSVTEVPQNVGEVVNKGTEFELSFAKSWNSSLSISSGFNISFLTNEITNLNGRSFFTGRDGQSHTFQEGLPMRSIWGYQVLGVFQNEEQLEQFPNDANAQPGDFIYRDLDGDSAITANDRTFLGQSIPTYTLGYNLLISYKGFDLSLLFQGAFGHKILLANANFGGGRGFFDIHENLIKDRLNRWHGEGTTNEDPRLFYLNDPGNNNRNSDYFVEEASYLRMKTIQVGYTMPAGLSDKIGLDQIRVYVGGTNLWTLTQYPGFDPEIAMEASDSFGWEHPMPKTYTVGLMIKF